jgi:uncharacterized protein (TIGR03083 family)
MEPLTPIDVAPLFRPLLHELIATLRSLGQEQWTLPTVAGRWRVRDVAAHLLDGDLRKVAVYRDGHAIPGGDRIATEQDLGRFINRLNASGVAYAERLSPRLLTDLLALTGGWVAEVIEALPPEGPATFPVSWAGESESQNWMDTGREYTERWHHQAQIRDAVGAPGLLAPPWMDPLLDFSVRALPHGYANIAAEPGTAVTLIVDGETSGAWSVVRDTARWHVLRGTAPAADAVVRVRTDDAWRLFYNALTEEQLREHVRVEGRRELAEPLLRTRSVIL